MKFLFFSLIVIFLSLISCVSDNKRIDEENEIVLLKKITTDSLDSISVKYLNFSLNKSSNYFVLDIKYPKFNAERFKQLNSDIENYYTTVRDRYEADALKEVKDVVENSSSEAKFEETISYEIFQDDKTLSVFFQHYSYTHGAHGNTFYKTFVVDLNSGKELGFSELLTFLELDIDTINSRIPDYFVNLNNCFSNTPLLSDSTEFFVVDKDSLLIYYAPYELGAYACGTYKLVLPINEMK